MRTQSHGEHGVSAGESRDNVASGFAACNIHFSLSRSAGFRQHLHAPAGKHSRRGTSERCTRDAREMGSSRLSAFCDCPPADMMQDRKCTNLFWRTGRCIPFTTLPFTPSPGKAGHRRNNPSCETIPSGTPRPQRRRGPSGRGPRLRVGCRAVNEEGHSEIFPQVWPQVWPL